MIEINDLNYNVKGNAIFFKASLAIDEGKIYWLQGNNGSGKTTLIRILSGLNNDYFFNDKNNITVTIAKEKLNLETIKNYTNYIPDDPYLFEYLNGKENIDYFISLFELERKREEILTNIAKLKLDDFLNKQVFTYSLGMKAKLFFSSMLTRETPLILIDELLNVVDKESLRIIFALLKEKTEKEKCTVLFTSHTDMNASLFEKKIIIKNKKFEVK